MCGRKASTSLAWRSMGAFSRFTTAEYDFSRERLSSGVGVFRYVSIASFLHFRYSTSLLGEPGSPSIVLLYGCDFVWTMSKICVKEVC